MRDGQTMTIAPAMTPLGTRNAAGHQGRTPCHHGKDRAAGKASL